MRKNCETCKHEVAEYPFYPYKTPCNKCETRYGSNTPSEWKPAEHYKPDTNADRIRAMSLVSAMSDLMWIATTNAISVYWNGSNSLRKCRRGIDDG